MALTYPEDRTGNLASNKITGEVHTITVQNSRNFHFIVPKFAPFYSEGLKLFQNTNNTQLLLEENVDYYFCYKFESASLSTTKEVFGGIGFMSLSLSGEIEIEYQTVGGNWTLDDQSILEITANEIYNPRGRTWDQVHGKPESFGPTSHIHDASDFLTDQEVGEKLDDIAQAILAGANRPANTAPVTLEQLGIPKIGNWGMATISEAVAGLSTNTIINPQVLRAVLDNLGVTQAAADMLSFKKHINNRNNPHEDDKESVGLSRVENVGLASNEQVLANQDNEGLISLTQLRAYLRMHGCQTAPEDSPKFLEKGALISYRCTSNYDRIGLFADGMGHTYENLVEAKSIDCGYKPPEKNNFPSHGTVLQFYCLDFDRWKIVADGYGGSYHAFVMANSGDCGYTGGGTISKPPAGTLLSAFCDGVVLVQTLANGTGGSYENRVNGHPDCANNVVHPPRGTLVSTSCNNKNEIGKYTDGAGGYYQEVLEQNSIKCGYVLPTTPEPVTWTPAGTPMGNVCSGTTLLNKFADGRGGIYTEVVEYNSSRCGGTTPRPTVPPTPPPTTPPITPAIFTYSSTMSYLTPQQTQKERHKVSIKNGRANSVYTGTVWMKGTDNQQNSFISGVVIYTNAIGEGNYEVLLGVFGKDPLAGFVKDDTYKCWAETTDGLVSNNVVRVYSGFGDKPNTDPVYGTYLGTGCSGTTLIKKYADGRGGFYTENVESNSSQCGGSTYPPAGTFLREGCKPGTKNFVKYTADGRGGEIETITEANSTKCGYTPDQPKTAVLTYSTSMNMLTPQTSQRERHTVTLKDGKPNKTYYLTFYLKNSAGSQVVSHNSTIYTNGTGDGTYEFTTHVYGKDPLMAFVPDDSYQCWVTTDDGVRSNTLVRIYSGFGQSPVNRALTCSSTKRDIAIGDTETYTVTATGYPPNTTVQIELQAKCTSQQLTMNGRDFSQWQYQAMASINIDSSGRGTWTLTQTHNATYIPAPSTWDNRAFDTAYNVGSTPYQRYFVPVVNRALTCSSTMRKIAIGDTETYTVTATGYPPNTTVQIELQAKCTSQQLSAGGRDFTQWQQMKIATINIDSSGRGTWSLTQIGNGGGSPVPSTWDNRAFDTAYNVGSIPYVRYFVPAGQSERY